MAEHLTSAGRAGIIVPEGIVFQSQNAYKQLRKTLLENYLVAVVSLPAGMFNPYSGVKTSILILDKALAKKTDRIAFFKVENDGFNLGAQRRVIEKNDLPQVEAELGEYLRRLRAGEPLDGFKPGQGQVVEKRRIAADGEYNLSAERYRENAVRLASWPMVPLKEVISLEYGKPLRSGDRIDGPYPVYGSNGIVGIHNQYFVEGPTVVIGRKGSAGSVTFSETACYPIDTTFYVKIKDPALLDIRYCYFQLRTLELDKVNVQSGVPGLNRNDAYRELIPLPPLEVQREIVAEIEGFQKVIDGARAVVENYRPHIVVDPEWPLVDLEDMADVASSKRILAEEYVPSGIPFYRTKEIVELSNRSPISSEHYISYERFDSIRSTFGVPCQGDILVSAVGTIGTSWVVSDERDFYFKDGNLLWIKNIQGADPYFLKYCMDSVFSESADNIVFGAAYKALTIIRLKQLKIPLPPLKTQQAIVAEIESEQEIVNANVELICRFEGKIRAAIERVWGEAPIEGSIDTHDQS